MRYYHFLVWAGLALTLLVSVQMATPAVAMPPEWTPAGPDGGYIYHVTVSVQEPQTLYARSAGGIHRSTDGGTRWQLVETVYEGFGNNPIEIDPTNVNHLIYAYDNGYYESTDGGSTWGFVGVDDVFSVKRVLFHPANAGMFYVYPYDEFGDPLPILRTTNGGTDFAPLMIEAQPIYGSFAFAPTTPARLYYSTSTTTAVSDDGGTTWQPLSNNGYPLLVVTGNETIYGYDYTDPGEPLGIMKSSDGGVTWGAANSGLPNTYLYQPFPRVVADPAAPDTLYYVYYKAYPTIEGAIYRTTNGGTSWHALRTDLPFTGFSISSRISIAPTTPTTLYFFDNGVYRTTTNGDSWEAAQGGLSAFALDDLQADPTNPQRLYGSYIEQFYRSTNGGQTWLASDSYQQEINEIALAPSDSTRLYAATGDGVLRSNDSGASWEAVNMGLPAEDSLFERIAVSPTDPAVVLVGADNGRVYRTTTGGNNWTEVYYQFPLLDLEFAPNSATVAYAAHEGSISRSDDGGASWQPVDGVGLPADDDIGVLAIHPTESNTLFAGTEGTSVLYKSTDAGATWQVLSVGAPANQTTFAIWFDPADPDLMVLATNRGEPIFGASDSGGLYRSSDGGATWAADTTGLPYPAVTDIVGDGTALYVNTQGGGVWRLGDVPAPLGFTTYLPVIRN